MPVEQISLIFERKKRVEAKDTPVEFKELEELKDQIKTEISKMTKEIQKILAWVICILVLIAGILIFK